MTFDKRENPNSIDLFKSVDLTLNNNLYNAGGEAKSRVQKRPSLERGGGGAVKEE